MTDDVTAAGRVLCCCGEFYLVYDDLMYIPVVAFTPAGIAYWATFRMV